MHRVKREFGGFVVTDGLSEGKKFNGKGAKAAAEKFAEQLNAKKHEASKSGELVGRGHRGRGGVPRGA